MNQNNDKSIASSLLFRAQKNDDEAWHRIHRLFGPLIKEWVKKSGVKEVDADDIAQQVLTNIYQKIDRFERVNESDTFTGWVWTMTKFRVLDYFKSQKDIPNASGGSIAQKMFDQVPEHQLESDVFDENTAALKLTRSVLVIIQSEFETSTWDAFWRATVEREKPADIAQSMGMTLHAVYKAKSRVAKRIREEMDGILTEKHLGEFVRE